MANSQINAKVKFTEDGAEQAAKKVDKLKNSSTKASDVVAQLNKKLDRIGKAAGISATIDSVKAVGSAFTFMKDTVGGAVSSLYGFLNGQASAGDNIAKLARSLGFSSKELEKFQYAANRGGISTEEFNSSMQKFSVNVAKAAGGEKKLLGLFNAMGVSLKDRNGKMKSNASLMLEVADVYTKLTNAQDKNRISAELFGKSAMKMSTVFESGSKGLMELMDRREALGGLLTPEDTKNAEDFEDKILDVSKAFEGVKREVAYTLMPAVNGLLDKLLSWWTGNGERIMSKVGVYSDKVAGVIGEIGNRIPGVIDSLGVAFDVVSELVQEFGVGNTAIAAIVTAITVTVVPALAAASAAAAAIGTSLSVVIGIAAAVSLAVVGIKEAIEHSDLLFNNFTEDWVAGFKIIKKGLKEISDFWRDTPVIGQIIDFVSPRVKFDEPTVGNIWDGGSGNSAASGIGKVPQVRDSSGESVMREYSERKTTTTNRVDVNFNGLPKGATVTTGPYFDTSVIDLNAGYVFGE